MDVHTDFPERLRGGTKVFLGDDHAPARIASTRTHGGALLVALRGLDSPEAVGYLRNTWVYVTAADRPPLPKGQVYHHQILGFRALAEDGRELGALTEILSTGANDVYVLKSSEGKELLLPAIPDVILAINMEKREIRVHLLEGLIE